MNRKMLTERWWIRARRAQMAHYKSAVKLERRFRTLGVWVVAANAIVGSAVFATLSEPASNYIAIKLIAGVISLVTAILAGIQAFDRAAERADAHRNAATQFSVLQRDLELFVATTDWSDEPVDGFLGDFNDRYGQLIRESPTADESSHRAAQAEIKAGDLLKIADARCE